MEHKSYSDVSGGHERNGKGGGVILELSQVKTCDLVEELKKRQGVQTEYAEPYEKKKISVEGPAYILVVID